MVKFFSSQRLMLPTCLGRGEKVLCRLLICPSLPICEMRQRHAEKLPHARDKWDKWDNARNFDTKLCS